MLYWIFASHALQAHHHTVSALLNFAILMTQAFAYQTCCDSDSCADDTIYLYGKQMVIRAYPYSEFQQNAYLMITHFKLIILDHPTATPVIPGRSIRTRHKAPDRKTGPRSSDSHCSPVVTYLRFPPPVRESISLSWENISSYTVLYYILMWYSNSLTKIKIQHLFTLMRFFLVDINAIMHVFILVLS